MQTVTLDTSVEIVLDTCCVCGVVFGFNRARYDRSRQHGDAFYCTNGHRQVYRETDVQRLTRELAAKDQQLATQKAATAKARDETAAAERRVIAQKAATTRLKNKAARGECPCCGRLFTDLHEHMKAEHPDFEQSQENEEQP